MLIFSDTSLGSETAARDPQDVPCMVDAPHNLRVYGKKKSKYTTTNVEGAVLDTEKVENADPYALKWGMYQDLLEDDRPMCVDGNIKLLASAIHDISFGNEMLDSTAELELLQEFVLLSYRWKQLSTSTPSGHSTCIRIPSFFSPLSS